MADLSEVSLALWSKFAARVQGVLTRALIQLASDSANAGFASKPENDLNRELFFRMSRISRDDTSAVLAMDPAPTLEREHTWSMIPTPEANNLPSPDDVERAPREDKRPDFQWKFQDDLEADEERAMRTYVVECKRLRHPSANWKFNENYVLHGAVRFIAQGHLYGKDDTSGAMVGYIQAMEVAAILAEVNGYLGSKSLPQLSTPAPLLNSPHLHGTSHILLRANSRSPFRLDHFWIDLRNLLDPSVLPAPALNIRG
jgi:hypothetical protein